MSNTKLINRNKYRHIQIKKPKPESKKTEKKPSVSEVNYATNIHNTTLTRVMPLIQH